MMRVLLWAVTATRIALLPVFLLMALRAQDLARAGADADGTYWAAVAVLAVMGLSDVVDGWLARRFDLATHAGAIADAVADKLVQVTVVAFFVVSDGPPFASLPAWYLAVVVARDLVLAGGWLALHRRRVPVRIVHQRHGRVATASVFVVLLWLVVGLPTAGLTLLALLSSAVIAASTAAHAKHGFALARTESARRRKPSFSAANRS